MVLTLEIATCLQIFEELYFNLLFLYVKLKVKANKCWLQGQQRKNVYITWWCMTQQHEQHQLLVTKLFQLCISLITNSICLSSSISKSVFFFYNCVLKNMLYLLGRLCSINNDKWIFHIVSYFYMVKWVWCIALFNVVAAVQGGLLISFWVFGVITDCGVGWAWPCCLPVIHRANIDISGDS